MYIQKKFNFTTTHIAMYMHSKILAYIIVSYVSLRYSILPIRSYVAIHIHVLAFMGCFQRLSTHVGIRMRDAVIST